MKHLNACYLAAVAGASISVGVAPASAQTVQVGVGTEYSSGSYGGTGDTEIYEVPVTFRVRTGDWSFRLRVPFASIQGPGGVLPGGPDDNGGNRDSGSNSGSGSSGSSGGSGSGSSGSGTTIDPSLGEVIGGIDSQGLADISLSATWSHDLSDADYLDLTGRATMPTGDRQKDLGTGETDFTFLAEIGHDFDGAGVYAFGGYKFRGGATRKDGAQFGAGGYFRPMEGVITGIDAGWSESSINGLDQSADLTAYTSFTLAKDLRLSVYALTGLTDNAPDFGAGLTLTWRTDVRRPTEDN
ncbi:MAG: hypothetical protein ABL956_17295 [Hyphomonadaceae bacterium]